jgi:GNAT superfamily N-acetyltransferase
MDIQVVDAATADLEELADLQRESFKGVIGTSALDKLLSELHSAAHYQRKYMAPAGNAKVVTVREQGKLLAVNAMVPETLRHDSGTTLGWQSCDTATHPDARGKGLFKTCLNSLREHLKEGEIFFGYPNANSMPGFLKFGWITRGMLDAYVAPLPSFTGDTAIQPINRFDERFDEFAKRMIQPGTVCIERSMSYLNWRYFSHADSPYSAFTYTQNGRIEGFAVVRSLPLRTGDACVVLEAFGSSTEIEGALLRSAIRWGSRHRAWPTLVFSTCWGERTWLRHGFVRLPRRVSPRQLALMGAGVGVAGKRVMDLEWRAHVGDWDVF